MKKSVKNVEEVKAILKKELPDLKEKFGVEGFVLYGSFVKGTAKKTSDVDILVDIKRPIGLGLVTLAHLLEDKLGRKVDIATLSHYKQSFGNPRYKHIAEDISKYMVYV